MFFNKKMNMMVMLMILCISTVFAQGQMQQQPQQQSQAQQLYMEYQQLQQQLQQLQQQAMSEGKLAEQGEALDAKITDAMLENNPDIQSSLDKRDDIIAQFQQAQQSGDQTKIQQLNQKYQTVNQKIQAEQQKVMGQPEIKEDVDDYQKKVMSKMEELNPDVQQMMDRMREIGAMLSAMQQQGQPQGGGQ